MGKRKAPLTFCNGAFCFSQCLYAQRFGLFAAPVNIVGVEQLVCLVTVGMSEELIVQNLNSKVILRRAQSFVSVIVVKNGCTNCTQIHVHTNRSGLNGLTAAVYTAAGASDRKSVV